MKFLFFNLPAHGHVNPSLPLVSELVRRGHSVTFFTSELFRKRVEATGAHFATLNGIGDDYFERHGQNGSTPWEVGRIMQETAATLLPDLRDLIEAHKPDAILYDSMCPWGYYAAQIAKVPGIASYSLIPLSPHMMRDRRVLPFALGVVVRGMSSNIKAIRLASSIARENNMKPLDLMHVLNMPGDLCILYSSAEFVPFASTLGSEFRFVGWTLQEPVAAEPFEHTSGRPLIYASLGTMINDNKGFFQAVIDAVAGTPYDLIVSTGGAFKPTEFGALPPNVSVREWVPQAQVLRQAALFVTHGGVNSIQDGLYCNLPLLLAPQQQEQTINSLAVIDQGAGLMLTRDKLNGQSVRSGIERLLGEPTFRLSARRLGASLRSGGGAVQGADLIEELMTKTEK